MDSASIFVLTPKLSNVLVGEFRFPTYHLTQGERSGGLRC